MARRNPPPASPPRGHAATMREVDQLPLPPETTEERAASASLTQLMKAAANALYAKNLANGVALAQQAAKQHGPLADVFAELGRRYGHLVEGKQRPKPSSCRAITSRADFVEVLLDVAGLSGASVAKAPRTTFRVIEGGAD